MGHQLVKADWNRLSPTKAVNQYQPGWTQWPRARLIRTNAPAISRSQRSSDISPLPPMVYEKVHDRDRHPRERQRGNLTSHQRDGEPLKNRVEKNHGRSHDHGRGSEQHGPEAHRAGIDHG